MPVASMALQAAPQMLQTNTGLAQTIIGGIGAHNTQSQIERLATPTYTPSKGIADYYQEALDRYHTSPYASQMYQEAQNRVAQSQASGVQSLQDRRSALAGVGALVGQSNRAMGQAGAQAERMRQQDFSDLARAAQMKGGEDFRAFQYNQLLPYEKRMSILGAKASGYNRLLSSGMQNLFGGVGGMSQMASSGLSQGLFSGTGQGGAGSYAPQGASLADTGGGVPSPAASYGTLLNPNTPLAQAGGGGLSSIMSNPAMLAGIM